jgi:alpha-glucosidase (family GH31 glycosyl hydrolase)
METLSIKGSLTRRAALRNIAIAGSGTVAAQMLGGAEAVSLEVSGKPVEVTLSAASSKTIRITIQAVENGLAQPVPMDGALAREQFGKTVARVRAVTASGKKEFRCGEFSVQISANPLSLRVTGKDRRVVQEFQVEAGGEVRFQLGEGALFGLGQGGPQFDKRGQVDQMGSGQGGFRLRTHGAKVPVPFLIGTSGWAIYLHQPAGAFDLSGDKGLFRPTQPAASIDIFLIASQDPASLLGEYAKISGYPEMAPLWSFGYQQSHRTLGSPEEIMQEAKIFREKKLPCDAMIYLGTDFCPNGWNTHNGEFDWEFESVSRSEARHRRTA